MSLWLTQQTNTCLCLGCCVLHMGLLFMLIWFCSYVIVVDTTDKHLFILRRLFMLRLLCLTYGVCSYGSAHAFSVDHLMLLLLYYDCLMLLLYYDCLISFCCCYHCIIICCCNYYISIASSSYVIALGFSVHRVWLAAAGDCCVINHKTVVAVNALSARVTEGVPINNTLYSHAHTRERARAHTHTHTHTHTHRVAWETAG